jgi:hypothetical protein
MSTSEKGMQFLEEHIPDLAQSAVTQAYWQALAAGQKASSWWWNSKKGVQVMQWLVRFCATWALLCRTWQNQANQCAASSLPWRMTSGFAAPWLQRQRLTFTGIRSASIC